MKVRRLRKGMAALLILCLLAMVVPIGALADNGEDPGGSGAAVVDKTALNTAITNASAILGQVLVGTGYGQTSQAAKDTFSLAIASAQQVADKLDATGQEAADAVTALSSAQTTFIESVKFEIDSIPGYLAEATTVDQTFTIKIFGIGSFKASLDKSSITLGGDFSGLTVVSAVINSVNPQEAIVTVNGSITYATGSGTVKIAGSAYERLGDPADYEFSMGVRTQAIGKSGLINKIAIATFYITNSIQSTVEATNNLITARDAAQVVADNQIATSQQILIADANLNNALSVFSANIPANITISPNTAEENVSSNKTFTVSINGTGDFVPGLSAANITLGGDLTGLSVVSATRKENTSEAEIVLSGKFVKNSGIGTIFIDQAGWTGSGGSWPITLTVNDVSPNTVNKTVLNSAISSAEALTAADYTTESWNNLLTKVTEAKTVQGKADATQTEVDSAVSAINSAIAALVFAGKADLDSAKASAAALSQADYTSASWAVLSTALAMPETTNAQVIAKKTAINSAVASLVLAGKTTLDSAKAAVTALVQTDYTAASWEVLSAALTMPETTNEQITAKATAINSAIAALVFAGKADLDSAKASAAALSQADYTSASWAVLSTALAMPETTNAQVIAKKTAINSAVASLVLAGKATLDSAKAAATALVQTDYTAASWAALSAALTMPETTNEQITAKATAINSAIAALVFAGKADLDLVKATAAALPQVNYSAASWEVLIGALAMPETTNSQVVTKTTAISNAITALAAANYTLNLGNETSGGAGMTRVVTINGTNGNDFTGKYLVVQFTEGTGASAKVSVVMISVKSQSVTISYQTAGTKIEAWLTSGMPNLTGQNMGVTVDAYTKSN